MNRMRVGYACVNTQLPSSARTVRLANATRERVRDLVGSNLDALERILRWNERHGIQVFRLTSNLVPFGSHEANELAWWDVFAARFAGLGAGMRAAGMRISTHPGQYTVLSSTRPEVVAAAVAELEYHDRMLNAFGLDRSHKIVLHVGAGASDPDAAYERFATAFERLPAGVPERLVLENDERWPLQLVLPLAEHLRLPVVFDVFHHRIAPSLPRASVRELVLRVRETWRRADGRQEVHFSTQEPGKRRGAHARTLDTAAFARFVAEVGDLPLDCVLEVKDKERSVLRAQELLTVPSRRDRARRADITRPMRDADALRS
jgi:UV DNA damage endonuclease